MYDVIVVGGGVYGACVLRDAALRGLSALLLERRDFGSATSHNSNKIVHSGIRYLQHLDVPRVLECIQETRNWMRIAPHLVEPLPFVVPSYGCGLRGKEVMGLGVAVHDFLKRRNACPLPAGGILGRKEVLEWFPMLDPQGLRGAAYWYDGQLQNANELIDECIQDACDLGAHAMSYTEVESILLEGGATSGVVARRDGERLEFRGSVVVNAAGPWLNDLLPSALKARHRFDRHYIGMNLVIDQVSSRAGLAMYGPGQGSEAAKRRLYFLTPWKNRSILGTSHVFFEGSPDGADYSAQAVDELAQAANQAFPFLELDTSKIRYVYRGLTPSAGDKETLTRSRQFSIVDHRHRDKIRGLISVMGVKLTSARFVAEQVVNLVERKLNRRITQCRTADRMLPGAALSRGDQPPSTGDSLEGLLAHAERGCVESLIDLVTCRTELAELGLLSLDDLRACADLMARARGWSADRREAEYTAARERLQMNRQEG